MRNDCKAMTAYILNVLPIPMVKRRIRDQRDKPEICQTALRFVKNYNQTWHPPRNREYLIFSLNTSP